MRFSLSLIKVFAFIDNPYLLESILSWQEQNPAAIKKLLGNLKFCSQNIITLLSNYRFNLFGWACLSRNARLLEYLFASKITRQTGFSQVATSAVTLPLTHRVLFRYPSMTMPGLISALPVEHFDDLKVPLTDIGIKQHASVVQASRLWQLITFPIWLPIAVYNYFASTPQKKNLPTELIVAASTNKVLVELSQETKPAEPPSETTQQQLFR